MGPVGRRCTSTFGGQRSCRLDLGLGPECVASVHRPLHLVFHVGGHHFSQRVKFPKVPVVIVHPVAAIEFGQVEPLAQGLPSEGFANLRGHKGRHIAAGIDGIDGINGIRRRQFMALRRMEWILRL